MQSWSQFASNVSRLSKNNARSQSSYTNIYKLNNNAIQKVMHTAKIENVW